MKFKIEFAKINMESVSVRFSLGLFIMYEANDFAGIVFSFWNYGLFMGWEAA